MSCVISIYHLLQSEAALRTASTHQSRDQSPLHRLIEAFADLTGVPLVLNTSFNENEPVVCRPEEALECFLRTQMDVLVLGNWIVQRAG
jgi:carbamoyltransferase